MQNESAKLQVYFFGLVSVILLACIFFLSGCMPGCKEHEPDIQDEVLALNTVCIDGVLCISVATKYDCDYVPIMVNNKFVECKEKSIDFESENR